jgi:hypothetical protein
MKAATQQERELLDYLLGALSEDQRVVLENRLFGEEGLDDELLASTDDLIHEYLQGTLGEDERRRFETHFLASPEHRDRLAWMRDLTTVLARTPATPSRPGTWPMFLLVAAAVAGIAFLLLSRRPAEMPERQAVVTPPVPTPAPPHTAVPTVAPLPKDVVRTVRLPRRPTVPADIRLASNTETVRVEVPVPDESPSYHAVIRTADGQEVWRAEDLAPESEGAPLIISVPSRILIADAYALRVEGEALRTGPTLALEYRLRVTRDR